MVVILPGCAGTLLEAVTVKVVGELVPQLFFAATEIVLFEGDVVPAETVILLEVAPAVLDHPVGTVQIYSVAFVMAGI